MWEAVLVPVAVVGFAGAWLVWAAGVLAGSLQGATLPGSAGDGLIAVWEAFPDVGRAWVPIIPSWTVWAATVVIVVAAAPIVWRVWRGLRLQDEGARWADTAHLRRQGLLIEDRQLPRAAPENPVVRDG